MARAADTAMARSVGASTRRSRWLKRLMQWHWISSAICLAGMLLFAVTGVTLNHAGAIEAQAQVQYAEHTLAPRHLATLQAIPDGTRQPLPPRVRGALAARLGQYLPADEAEWDDGEVYLAMPRPGGDAWLSIDVESGAVAFERTGRGWVAWLNDLHKGRNTGTAWRWFIDVFAVACIVFSLTGLLILWLHARNRPMVWPLVGLGTVVPLLLILLFIH